MKKTVLLILFNSLILDIFFYIYIKGFSNIKAIPAVASFTVFQLVFIFLMFLIVSSSFYISPFYFFISIFSSAGLALLFYDLLLVYPLGTILGLAVFIIPLFLLFIKLRKAG